MEDRVTCVLLADRNHALTEGVRGMLESKFETVVMVADETSLLQAALRLQPDLTVVDLSLSRQSNLEWLRALRRQCPALKVVVVSVHDESSVRRSAMAAGADRFVLKREIATALLPTIEHVLAQQG